MSLVHFIQLLMALGILVVVGYPLFTRHEGENVLAPHDPVEEEYKHWLVRKEEILLSIKELEFDHKTGKLSGEDYDRMNKKLEAEAVAVLASIDRVEEPRDARKPSGRKAGKV